jgi:hypothetical protein
MAITAVLLILNLLLIFVPLPGADSLAKVAFGSALLGWYFTLGKSQAAYVRQEFPSGYQKKSWAAPLGIGITGVGAYLALVLLAITLYGPNPSDLAAEVKPLILQEWHKDPKLRGATIQQIALVHKGRKVYTGFVDATLNGHTERLTLEVVVDRGSLLWLLSPLPRREEEPQDAKLIPRKRLTKDGRGALQYMSKRRSFALYLLPDVWKRIEPPENPEAEAQFIHKAGDASAMIITERTAFPLDIMKKAAIANWQKTDPDARILEEEVRIVNGKEVLCLTAALTSEGIAYTVYGYYYSDERGSVQILTWTGQNVFRELKPELEAFLNGFVVIRE